MGQISNDDVGFDSPPTVSNIRDVVNPNTPRMQPNFDDDNEDSSTVDNVGESEVTIVPETQLWPPDNDAESFHDNVGDSQGAVVPGTKATLYDDNCLKPSQNQWTGCTANWHT
jgi:hypothetical protein